MKGTGIYPIWNYTSLPSFKKQNHKPCVKFSLGKKNMLHLKEILKLYKHKSSNYI